MLIIIPCGAKKRSIRCPARSMYIGAYFKACLRWALSVVEPQQIRILSSKYGLLELDQIIAPYELTMDDPLAIRTELLQNQASLLMAQKVIAIGGKRYTSKCRQVFPDCIVPFENLKGIGYQMQWLKQNKGKLPASTGKPG